MERSGQRARIGGMSDELLLSLLTDPEVIVDPYPWLDELRAVAPVHKAGFTDLWVLSRFDDCRAVLRDPRLGVPETGSQIQPFRPGSVYASQGREDRPMMFQNPPEHTRLRALVGKALGPFHGMVSEIVAEVAGDLLDEIEAAGGGDLIQMLAVPLPESVLCDALGVPRTDQTWLRPLIQDLSGAIEPSRSVSDIKRAEVARQQLRGYIDELVIKRQAEPSRDFVSAMLAVSVGDDRLTPGEIAATAILLYVAGVETSSCLIGNAIHLLLQWPDQLERLRADRSLIPSAVEEMLRFEAPVQVDARCAFEDVEIDGNVVAAGHSVLMLLGAANRDPAAVQDPNRFDVGRDHIPHLSFGAGIHRCLGASLALASAGVVLEMLLDRFETLTALYDTPAWRPRLAVRGLETLPVSVA